ncbi:MAG: MBL fold metallo-hydrolase [Bacteroidota bacterium]
MKLTVLGCGDAFGNGGRNNTSFLFTEDNKHILLDCGATTLVRLKHEKINLEDISTIVISHFHGDHFGGLPFFFISSMFEKPRRGHLSIVGPKGLKGRVFELQEAMYKGTTEKLQDLDISFHEYTQGLPLTIDDLIIQAWEVDHSLQSIPHGIRLEWRGKHIGFSGDTSWVENLVPLSDNTDLFICECNFLDKVSFGHLSYEELFGKSKLLNAKQLWISHMANEVIDATYVELNKLSDGQKIIF